MYQPITKHLKTWAWLLVLLAPFSGKAAHIIGGEISYVSLGSNDFRVTLELYRDCNGGGAPFDDPVWLFIYEASSGLLHDAVSIPLPGFSDITPDLSDPCLINPPILCVERAEYITTINLPDLPGGYNIVYQRCCRNGTIENIIDPGGTGSTYVAFVPDPASMTNSSPKFDLFPPLVICKDEFLTFDHSATDPDGDVLVYELCAPFEGASAACPAPSWTATMFGCPQEPGPPPYGNVTYWPPYSATMPLEGTLSINPSTGQLTGTPTLEGQFVVGICVKEYRAGVLIGTHYRDFQFNVADCDRAIVAASTDVVVDCKDLTVTFDNFSTGATSFLWDFGVGGATSTDSVPTFTFPDTGTYYVTLIAEPGVVCTDTFVAEVSLYPIIDADFDFMPACPGAATDFLDQTTLSFGNLSTWLWDFGDGALTHVGMPEHDYDSGGTYFVTMIVGSDLGCLDTITKAVNIPHSPKISIDYDVPCLDEIATFWDSSTVVGSTVTDWFWELDNGSQFNGNPAQFLFDSVGIYELTLEVTGDNGCKSDTTIEIEIRPPTLAEVIDNDTICEGESIQLAAGGGFFYLWSPAETLNYPGLADPIASPTVTTTYIVDVSDYCTSDTAQLTIVVLPAPDTEAWPDTTIFNGESLTLNATGGVSYLWEPSVFLSDSSLQYPEAFPNQDTWFYVNVTGSNGCSWLDSLFINVLPVCDGFTFPNAFTPNQDGLNDVFRAKRTGDDRFQSLEIYNRWGNLIFRSSDEFDGWDGTWKGKKQEIGTYVYTLRSICEGNPTMHSGTLNLLR
jgi:gliding motility-associated-like protein